MEKQAAEFAAVLPDCRYRERGEDAEPGWLEHRGGSGGEADEK